MNEATALRVQLVKAQPKDLQWRERPGRELQPAGELLLQPEAACGGGACYQLGLRHQRLVAAALPNNPQVRDDLGLALNNLGITLVQVGQPEGGLELIAEAIAWQKVTFARAPQSPRYREGLGVFYTAQAEGLRKLGRLSEAVAVTRKRQELYPDDPQELFRIAVGVSRVLPLVGAGKKKLSPEELAVRRGFEDQTLEVLRTAVAKGFRDAKQLRSQVAFALLRQRPEFQELVRAAQK